MRTYGRVRNLDGTSTWVEVQTDANGFDDGVYVTTLVQCLKLVLGESPFYANYGIPAQQSLIQQIFPDFYVAQTQAQFTPFFASLMVSKLASETPTYNISVMTAQGASISFRIPV